MYSDKYIMEYDNVSGDTFKLIIARKGIYDGDLIELSGNCIYSIKSVDNIFAPVRGASLKINFLASVENPFDEFNVIQEFELQAKFYRNDLEIFRGWINPDGIFQDYVNQVWQVSLLAVDGLGFIKNYAFSDFVDDVNINNNEFNYIYSILSKLNLDLPIALYDDINNLFNSSGNPTSIELINPNKRVVNLGVFKNKNENFLDCNVVISDILNKYNMMLVQDNLNGELCWSIYRIPFLTTGQGKKGVIIKKTSYTGNQPNWFIDSYFDRKSINIYSDGVGILDRLIHCNANQQISYRPQVKNIRAETKWLGYIDKGFPITADYFSNTSYADFVTGGLEIDGTVSPNLAATQIFAINTVKERPVNLKLSFYYSIDGLGGFLASVFRCKIIAVNIDTSDPVYLANSEDGLFWSETDTLFELPRVADSRAPGDPALDVTTVIETPLINNVNLYLYIYTPTVFLTAYFIILKKIEVNFLDSIMGIGEYHDSIQPNVETSFLVDPIKVINTNQNNDIFLNNIYTRSESGVLAPQSLWKRGNIPTSYVDLLKITTEDRITMLQRPQMIFKGDVFGFLNYACLVNYNEITGNFLPISYNYDTQKNIISLTSHQYFLEDIEKEYEKMYTFEDERNVLIK